MTQYHNKAITGDANFTGGDHWRYIDNEGGLNMSFIGTNHDVLLARGSNETITGTGNVALTLKLAGFDGQPSTGNHLSFDGIREGMTIRDFDGDKGDTLTLTNEGFRSSAAAFHGLTSDCHGGEYLTVAGSSSIHFVNSNVTAASLIAVHTV